MSDNWNLLAKLLGTPGPPAPPKKTETKKRKEPDPVATGGEPIPDSSSSSLSDRDESASRKLPAVAEAAAAIGDSVQDQDDVLSAESVLEALTSETVVSRLPGFGVRARDPRIDELAAGGPTAKEQPIVRELLEKDTSVSESDKLFAEDTAAPQAEIVADTTADESAWSELAGELGIGSLDEPPPHRAPIEVAPPRREPIATKSKKSSPGFGVGLGLDLGVDAETDDEAPALLDGDSDDDSFVSPRSRSEAETPASHSSSRPSISEPRVTKPAGAPDPLSFRSFADLDDDFDDEPETAFEVKSQPAAAKPAAEESFARDRVESRPERQQSRRGFDQRDSDRGDDSSRSSADRSRSSRNDRSETSAPTDKPSRDRDSDGESPRGPGRRGRRGQRQRMTEDAIDFESESPESMPEVVQRRADSEPEKNRDDEDSRGRPRRRRRRGSGGGRESVRRDEFGRLEDNDEDDVADDHDIEMADDEFGIDLDLEFVEEETEDETPAAASRRRRRGRRGRGGRRPRGEGDGEPSRAEELPSARSIGRDDDADDEDDDFEEDLIPESAFDDDHEDDEEVEVIRRGRRRRGRRGGRGRSSRDSETPETDERGGKELVASDDADEDRYRRGGRSRIEEDEVGPPRAEDVNRRKIVPTWQEVVNLLVDNNLENHKKSPKGRPTKGRRR